ncbi:hypothetical protein N9B73_04135 [Verrucomicrobiales bacterium]|jgi:hypothetical protein|nr:hypothetical protein [Verrucomicrobiales bacterium]
MFEGGSVGSGGMVLSIAIPQGSEWIYYAVCGLFFSLCGVFCGYFIWRKGFLQTLDAELEVRRTEDELQNLRHDLSLEEDELSSGADSDKGS